MLLEMSDSCRSRSSNDESILESNGSFDSRSRSNHDGGLAFHRIAPN